MLQKKYIAATTLCIAMLMQGAASDAPASSNTNPSKKMTLLDCFEQKTVLAPGPERFYVPFAKHWRTEKTKETGSILGFGGKNVTKKYILGMVGIVEGDDPEMTKQIAQSVLNQHPDTYSAHRLPSAIACAVNGLAASLPKTENVQLAVRYIVSTDEDLNPLEVIDFQYYIAHNIRNNRGIFSPYVSPAILNQTSAKLKNCRISATFENLTEYAKNCPTFHTAIYLVLNPNRYRQFVEQEFCNNTNICSPDQQSDTQQNTIN